MLVTESSLGYFKLILGKQYMCFIPVYQAMGPSLLGYSAQVECGVELRGVAGVSRHKGGGFWGVNLYVGEIGVKMNSKNSCLIYKY